MDYYIHLIDRYDHIAICIYNYYKINNLNSSAIFYTNNQKKFINSLLITLNTRKKSFYVSENIIFIYIKDINYIFDLCKNILSPVDNLMHKIEYDICSLSFVDNFVVNKRKIMFDM